MIRLGKVWMTMVAGCDLLVGPVTDVAAKAAHAAFREAKGDRDFKAEPEAYEECHLAYVIGMARHTVFDWRGVGAETGDEGLPYDPDLLPDLFQHVAVRAAFEEAVVSLYLQSLLEKNGSSRLRNGSSQSVVGTTAGNA